jgi:alcohol dehydrogenase
LAQKYGVTAIGQGTQTTTNRLNRLSELVESGKIKVNIDKEFSIDDAKEAFDYQEQIHPRGKVVLIIKK